MKIWMPFEEFLKVEDKNTLLIKAVRQEELGYTEPLVNSDLIIALVKGYHADKVEITKDLLLIYHGLDLYAAVLEEMDNSELQDALNEGDISFLPLFIDFNNLIHIGKTGLLCPKCKYEERYFTVKQTTRQAYMAYGETGRIDFEDVEDTPITEKKLVCSECEEEYDFATVHHLGKDYAVIINLEMRPY